MIVGKPLVNGIEYTHADVIVNLLGFVILGITNIKYKDTQVIELNLGSGQYPVSRGFGGVVPEGSITITSKEANRLSAAAPNGLIQNIPDFDIGVNFTTEAGDFMRHRLVRCRFKGRNPDSSVGNSQIEEELELSIAAIQYT